MVRVSKKAKMTSLLHELLKDSSRSDREIGRAMGVSQPTVSKMKKTFLEKGLFRGFTIIPNFSEIGYKLLALTFVKIKPLLSSAEKRQKGHETANEWMMEHPNVIFCDYCRGMGFDAFMISFHKSYEDFDKFIQKHNQELGFNLNDVQSILVNLAGKQTLKPFNFKYLAENMKKDT